MLKSYELLKENMKKIFSFCILFFTSVAWAGPYDDNSFSKMPHKKIMDLNINNCEVQANAAGNPELAHRCVDNQKQSFDYLFRIYQAKDITSASWSLCIAESKIGDRFDYMLMLACMKVIKDICPEKADGQWVNPNLCINSIESGAWINNPKIFQPSKYSLKVAP